MTNTEIKALVSLLEDNDPEVKTHVEKKIRSLGGQAIPFLEQEWEQSFNPLFQQEVEDLIHDLQFEALCQKLESWKNSPEQELLEGMWLMATYMYPDLSLDKLKDEINQIYYNAWVLFKPDMSPSEQVRTLNHVFFNQLKFGSNTRNFHSANNSMLNAVLESKKGNPLSLCTLYMLVGQKLGMPLYGVNLPNLFALTYKTPSHQFYINVFNKGLVFTKFDIDNFIKQLNVPPSDIFYQPCSSIDMIRRVCRNLVMAFEKVGDEHRTKEMEKLIEVLERI